MEYYYVNGSLRINCKPNEAKNIVDYASELDNNMEVELLFNGNDKSIQSIKIQAEYLKENKKPCLLCEDGTRKADELCCSNCSKEIEEGR